MTVSMLHGLAGFQRRRSGSCPLPCRRDEAYLVSLPIRCSSASRRRSSRTWRAGVLHLPGEELFLDSLGGPPAKSLDSSECMRQRSTASCGEWLRRRSDGEYWPRRARIDVVRRINLTGTRPLGDPRALHSRYLTHRAESLHSCDAYRRSCRGAASAPARLGRRLPAGRVSSPASSSRCALGIGDSFRYHVNRSQRQARVPAELRRAVVPGSYAIPRASSCRAMRRRPIVQRPGGLHRNRRRTGGGRLSRRRTEPLRRTARTDAEPGTRDAGGGDSRASVRYSAAGMRTGARRL